MPSEIEARAIKIVQTEREQWENATAFITEKVSFQMRNLIRQLRKNYWGIFDLPQDQTTLRKKTWIPLTESIVETCIKNIDLDTKDINLRAKHPSAIGFTKLARAIVKNYLDDSYFGEDLDEFERQLAIDGTAVWKTVEGWDPLTKLRGPRRINVDILNVYIDPTARSIQEAYRFTERSLLSVEEVKNMKGWINTDGIQGTSGLNRTDPSLYGVYTSTGFATKLVDVWEMWGKIPKFLMTGDSKDEREEVNGHVIVSGLERGKEFRVHLIETYKGLKPYEEAWYTRIAGRWYGKGVAEKVIWLQQWLNTIVNIRINRAYVSQLGLFKIKKGAGITPAMIARLSANGALLVNDMSDIEQMIMSEASQASYKDEENAVNWAQKVTSAFEAVTGEQMPASTPATNVAIQSRQANSQFVFIKKGVGMFLQRWLKRQALPIIMKYTSLDDVVRMTDEYDALKEFDELFINGELMKELAKISDAGLFFDPSQVEQEKQRLLERLQKTGKDRFISLKAKVDFTHFDVQVYITNEEQDKGIMTSNLLSMLNIVPEYKDQIVEQVFDLLGVGPFKKPQQLPGQQAQQPGVQAPTQNPQQQLMNSQNGIARA